LSLDSSILLKIFLSMWCWKLWLSQQHWHVRSYYCILFFGSRFCRVWRIHCLVERVIFCRLVVVWLSLSLSWHLCLSTLFHSSKLPQVLYFLLNLFWINIFGAGVRIIRKFLGLVGKFFVYERSIGESGEVRKKHHGPML
jgi:hypothetical protein